MRPFRSLKDPAHIEEIAARLRRLEPTSPRQWGKMTPHEMLCHLADAFHATLGERQITSVETALQRTLVKWIALHTSIPWPKGIPTTPEVDPHRLGTKPVEFERDRTEVIALVRRFASPDANYGRHPAFGAMTREEWLLWAYGHPDHHLRQFGL